LIGSRFSKVCDPLKELYVRQGCPSPELLKRFERLISCLPVFGQSIVSRRPSNPLIKCSGCLILMLSSLKWAWEHSVEPLISYQSEGISLT
jgi:hypothetical protein